MCSTYLRETNIDFVMEKRVQYIGKINLLRHKNEFPKEAVEYTISKLFMKNIVLDKTCKSNIGVQLGRMGKWHCASLKEKSRFTAYNHLEWKEKVSCWVEWENDFCLRQLSRETSKLWSFALHKTEAEGWNLVLAISVSFYFLLLFSFCA